MNAALKSVEAMVDAMFTPPHRFLVVEQDGTETHREPTKGNRYQLMWAYSGELEHYPCEYIGNGMFQCVEDGTGWVRASDGDPFKVDPSEVEYIEELS